jgi:hypothetical protein
MGPQGIKICITFNVSGRMYSLYVPAHIVLPDGIRAIMTEQTPEGNIGAGIVIGGLAGRCNMEFCDIGISQLAWINRFSTFHTFPFGNFE